MRAAVCPGAPLLIPGLAPRLGDEAPGLLDACAVALTSLQDVDRLILLAGGPHLRDGTGDPSTTVLHPPGTAVSSAILTNGAAPAHFAARLPGPADGDYLSSRPPGVGVTVGAALADRAGLRMPTSAVEFIGDSLPIGPPPVDVSPALDVLLQAASGVDRVGVLLIGDGSGSRGAASPGGADPAAEDFDRALAAALADGDPTALQAVAIGSRPGVLFTSGPVFATFGALTSARPPDRADVLYADAPLGVGYIVATWSWS